jgi:phosphohistidine phosphatase
MNLVQLVLVRHGIAGDGEAWRREGRDDRVRPLTEEGRRRMRRAAAGLRAVAPEIAVWATSPLTRAAQTAEILAQEHGGVEVVVLEELSPGGDPGALIARLGPLAGARTVVGLVGHEPDLGELAGVLCAGERRPIVAFKKGGACLLETSGDPRPGGATLVWALPPAVLRRLA